VLSNVEQPQVDRYAPSVFTRAVFTRARALARPSRHGEQPSPAGKCHSASGQPQQLVPHCRGQSASAIASVGLRTNPRNARSPPFLLRGQCLLDRKAASVSASTSASSTASPTPGAIDGDMAWAASPTNTVRPRNAYG
jgi:hypothetical protein